MSINRTCLHAFHIVASEGSFSRAADAYYVSQPTLSAQVKELESRYNIKLLERHGKGVRPTSIGRSLLNLTQQMFNLETEAEQLLISTRSKTTGILRIGADSPYLIIPLMAVFRGIYPDVKLHIDFGNSKQLLDSLKARRYDLTVLPISTPSDNFFSIALQSTRLIAFVNREHRWAEKQNIRLADLESENVVLRESGSNTRLRFETIAKQLNISFEPGKTLVIGSREGVYEAVAAGLGVGIVDENEFGHDKRLKPLILRDVKTKHTQHIVCLEKRQSEHLISLFLETISLKGLP